MAAVLHSEGPSLGVAQQSHGDGPNAIVTSTEPMVRHDSLMENYTSVMSSADMLSMVAGAQALMRQRGRHDSVLSTAKKPTGECTPGSIAPNLGPSILKTPSVGASPTHSFSHRHSPTTLPKTPGSIWLHRYSQNWWPVILCDEQTAPPKFMGSRHSPTDMPAILLGKRI